jgi:hypothetical protein
MTENTDLASTPTGCSGPAFVDDRAPSNSPRRFRSLLKVARVAALAAVISGGLFAWSYLRYGSPWPVVALLRGESFYIEVPPRDLGKVRFGDSTHATFQVYNLSDRMFQVVGTNSNCSCIRAEEVPIEVPPGESRPIHFRTVANLVGRQEKAIGIFTDYPSLTEMGATVVFECVPK